MHGQHQQTRGRVAQRTRRIIEGIGGGFLFLSFSLLETCSISPSPRHPLRHSYIRSSRHRRGENINSFTLDPTARPSTSLTRPGYGGCLARVMTEPAPARGRPQRIYKKRESRLAYRNDNISRYFNYGVPSPAPLSAGQRQDPNSPLAKFPVPVPQDAAYLDLLSFQSAASNAPGLSQPQAQIQKDHYQNASSRAPYTFPSGLPPASSLAPLDSAPVSPLALGPSQAGVRNGYHFTSQASAADVFPSDGEDVDMSPPGSRVGSLDSLQSFSSMAPSLGTQASSVSEGYVWPVTDPLNSATMADAIHDLSLSRRS